MQKFPCPFATHELSPVRRSGMSELAQLCGMVKSLIQIVYQKESESRRNPDVDHKFVLL